MHKQQTNILFKLKINPMPTRGPDLAERNSEKTATRVDAAQEAQDRPKSKLRTLWEGLKDRSVGLFRQALERLRNSTQTKRDELTNQAERNELEAGGGISSPETTIKKPDEITRRDFLRLGAAVAVAACAFAAGVRVPTVSAAEAKTSPIRPNSETEALVPELEKMITEAKDFIASKVPMLEAYPDTLQPMERPKPEFGLQIPSDIGNPPSPDPNKPNKNGFELGSRIYSPYPDSNDQEKGVVYKRIITDLTKITELQEYKSASPEKQKEMLQRYLNSLAEQILERQKRYSAAMSEFPGKLTRVGIGAEVVDYVNFIADKLKITDPDIKAAILRTHPHVAQIIAMQQAGFDVDIQMNGLPPGFVEQNEGNSWPIFNPLKPEAIQAFVDFVRILSLALPEKARMSTANEPVNIHMGNQAEKYARGLVQAQLDNNDSNITLIGPSIKTDYDKDGRFDTTLRIIDSFIAEIERVIKENNITDPDQIKKLLNCLPTLTVYSKNATDFMAKANALVTKIGRKIQELLGRLTKEGLLKSEVNVRINFSEMGIEWPYYQGESGLNAGTREMIEIVKKLKSNIESWGKSYPWLEFTGIFFIHNPGGLDYGKEFDEYATKTTSGIPIKRSFIPIIGEAPKTEPKTNDACFERLCNAVR